MGQNLIFENFPKFDRDGMGDVLVSSVFKPSRRHAENQPFVSRNDFHVANDKAVVKGHRRESLELIFVAKMNANFSDIHPFLTGSWLKTISMDKF